MNSQSPKHIETKEYPDGRKDVHIGVNMLDVNEKDPATLKAKEVIENEVLPKLSEADVLVVVVHKPTNEHAEKVVKLPHVRAYAEACVKAHGGASSEFVVVEHHITNGTVKVTTL